MSAAAIAATSFYRSPYRGAERSPHREPIYGSPEDHSVDFDEATREDLLQASRFAAKNVGLAVENHRAMSVYAIGSGLRVKPTQGSESWQKRARDVWEQFAESPEVSGRYDLTECEKIISRRLDEDGEIFVLKTRDDFGNPKIQLIPSHRIGPWKPGTIDGLDLDKFGRVRRYCYRGNDGTSRWLKGDSVMHIFDPEDPSAGRGVPTMAHATNHMRDELELLDLEKHAVKDNADVTRAIHSSNPDVMNDDDFALSGDSPLAGTSRTSAEDVQRRLGGRAMRLEENEKLESYESKRPNPTFTGFIEHLRRDSSLGMLPHEFTAKPGDASGAAIRLVVSRADRRFTDRQQLVTRRFLKPLWFYVIGSAISRGEIRTTPGWWKIKVGAPRRVTVDAGREGKENRADVMAGLKCLGDHFDELGKDYEEELEQRAKELKRVNEVAEKYGVDPKALFAGIMGDHKEAPDDSRPKG